MKYKGYSAADFANDSFFIRWVKTPDPESEWFWVSFIKENPECRKVIDEARELILLFDSPVRQLPETEMAQMRHRLLMHLRMDKEAEKDHSFINPSRLSGYRRRWMKLAAAVIIIPLVCTGLFFLWNQPDDFVSSVRERKARDIAEKISPKGQQSVLFLSDGTRIWVNGSTKLTYEKTFEGHATRDVYLEGEAFFEVAHNADKPFIVHTSSIKIKVLGTAFNVKSYSEQNTVETTLLSGKVRIEQSDARGNRVGDVELKPNQRAVFNKASKIINIKEVAALEQPAWRRDRLVFDEASIDQVLAQLERWYGVDIHIDENTNLNCKLTATIEKESLEDVLTLLQVSHGILFKIAGKDVYIKGKFCDLK